MDEYEWVECSHRGFSIWLAVRGGTAVRHHEKFNTWEIYEPRGLPADGNNGLWCRAPAVTTLEEAKALAITLWRMGGGS